jgi:rare lipoprotein A
MRKILVAIFALIMIGGCSIKTLDAAHYPEAYYVNASWYSVGTLTASGEQFNPDGATVAHKSYPFGTKLRLTNPNNGKSVIVKVNDRGPFTKGVELDISRGGAQKLGIIKQGRAKVRVELLTSR